MSQFKNPAEAAQFINAQKTRQYKQAVYDLIKKDYGDKFASSVRNLLKRPKKDDTV